MQMAGSSQSPGPLLIDKMVIGYLTLTALLAWPLEGGSTLGLRHLFLILAVLLLRHLSPRLAWLQQTYSVLLVPLLYLELDVLSGLAGGALYDPVVQRWEHALFGGTSPAAWMSERLPFYWLSELLHFCYLAYYPMLFLLAWRLFRQADKRPFYAYLVGTQAATFTIYLIQMFFPVQGPRPLFPPLDESLQGPFWGLCHYLCGQGAAGAAAFPSGHVTFAVAVTLAAARWDPRAYRWLLPLSIGLCLSTIYGRFHYGVDVIAGGLVGWVFSEFPPGAASLSLAPTGEVQNDQIPQPERQRA